MITFCTKVVKNLQKNDKNAQGLHSCWSLVGERKNYYLGIFEIGYVRG
jgi:hypothetical protein